MESFLDPWGALFSFNHKFHPYCARAVKAIHEDMGFTTMMEVQQRCIPLGLDGHDVLGMAIFPLIVVNVSAVCSWVCKSSL